VDSDAIAAELQATNEAKTNTPEWIAVAPIS
jgi:hypothetical protein